MQRKKTFLAIFRFRSKEAGFRTILKLPDVPIAHFQGFYQCQTSTRYPTRADHFQQYPNQQITETGYLSRFTSFLPGSDKRQLPFVKAQTKECFLSSRFRHKKASFRRDSDERQLPFVKAQTKDCFLSSRFRPKIASFCRDSDERQLPFVHAFG